MNKDLNSDERNFLKLLEHFKKRVPQLELAGKMDETLHELIETGSKLGEQLEIHAGNRAAIQENHEQLKGMVRDNAKCPQCASAEQLKVIGTDRNEKGWLSNKYRCRKCNITFVWNAPNNPWDMIPYVEDMIARVESQMPESQRNGQTAAALQQMKDNIAKLKPVVENSDLQMKTLAERDAEIAGLVNTITKHLMIQKIRLDD